MLRGVRLDKAGSPWAARMYAQRGSDVLLSLTTIAFLAWRKNHIPISLEGKIIYIGCKERAEPGSG